MKNTKFLVSALFLSQVAFAGNLMADTATQGLVTTNDDAVVKSASGECVRTSQATSDMREECDDVMRVEVVDAATAGSLSARVGDEVVIAAGMLFAFDSAELSDDAKAVIDERIERVKGRVKMTSVMRVEGHTDSVGSEAYNQMLSEKRAQAVADYIAENSYRVKADDIEVVGKGESNPIASNDTAEGRATNRRVVIFTEGEVEKTNNLPFH